MLKCEISLQLACAKAKSNGRRKAKSAASQRGCRVKGERIDRKENVATQRSDRPA